MKKHNYITKFSNPIKKKKFKNNSKIENNSNSNYGLNSGINLNSINLKKKRAKFIEKNETNDIEIISKEKNKETKNAQPIFIFNYKYTVK